jgi:hypothetical protein
VELGVFSTYHNLREGTPDHAECPCNKPVVAVVCGAILDNHHGYLMRQILRISGLSLTYPPTPEHRNSPLRIWFRLCKPPHGLYKRSPRFFHLFHFFKLFVVPIFVEYAPQLRQNTASLQYPLVLVDEGAALIGVLRSVSFDEPFD